MHAPRAASTRRAVAHGVVLLGLLAGCGGGDSTSDSPVTGPVEAPEDEPAAEPGATDDWSPATIAISPDAPVQPSLAVSPVAVGRNRIAFGLVDQNRQLVDSAEVEASFWVLTVDDDGTVSGRKVGEHTLNRVQLPQDYSHEHADGSDHVHGGRDATVYVAEVDLIQPEWWGAELSIVIDGDRLDPMRVPFWVDADAPEPVVGEPIPASVQLTTADADIELIDSADPPRPELHDITIADALRQGRPLVIAFATAAFCQTQFCGPVLDGVVVPLSEQYGDEFEFIVVEPFDLELARQGELIPVPIMDEWGLTTEPWVFVIDTDGVVTHRFQGITSLDEVGSALEHVLAG